MVAIASVHATPVASNTQALYLATINVESCGRSNESANPPRNTLSNVRRVSPEHHLGQIRATDRTLRLSQQSPPRRFRCRQWATFASTARAMCWMREAASYPIPCPMGEVVGLATRVGSGTGPGSPSVATEARGKGEEEEEEETAVPLDKRVARSAIATRQVVANSALSAGQRKSQRRDRIGFEHGL